MVQNINRLLAESLGPLNAALAVVFLLLGLSAGLAATAGLGPVGRIGGVAAIEDVSANWKFRPARLKGEPVDVYSTIAIQFKLRR